jgi:hypothetical protein
MHNDKENDSDSANELVAAEMRAAVNKLSVHDAKPAVARANRRVRPLQCLGKTGLADRLGWRDDQHTCSGPRVQQHSSKSHSSPRARAKA